MPLMTLQLNIYTIKHIFTAVTCAALSLVNGQITYNKPAVSNGKYPVDTTISFTCNYGYRRSGSTSGTCQTSGTWNQQPPTCTQGNQNN